MADYLILRPPIFRLRAARGITPGRAEPDGSHWHDCSQCCQRWHHVLAAYAVWVAAGLDCAGQPHLICDACTERAAPATPPLHQVAAPRPRR